MIPSSNAQAYSSAISFPVKLHTLLEDASQMGFDDIICWQPGGTSFKVLQPERFAEEIMQKYFQQTKYKSFQRQINTYGFKRVQHGPMKGGYTHPMFTRGNSNVHITRKNKQTKKLATRKPSDEIGIDVGTNNILDLASSGAPFSLESSHSFDSDESAWKEVDNMLDGFLFASNDALLFDGDLMPSIEDISDSSESEGMYSLLLDEGSQHEEAEKNVDSDSQTADGYNSDSSARDSSSDRFFPCKLFVMLEDAERENFSDIVSWVEDGAAFKVHKRKEFVETVMPNYFDQTQFESFRRQLNMYGFSRIHKGKDRGVVSHPYFLKGERALCQQITRIVKLSSTSSI